MKEIIQTKLDQMEDVEQRTRLKKILGGVFMELVDHQQEAYEELEERVFNQVEDQTSNYDIYNTIVPRDRAELVSDFLYPMLEEDLEGTYDRTEIIEKLREQEKVTIGSVFFKIDCQEIQKLKDRDKVFSGQIISEEEEYSISVKLKYKADYIKQEQKLHQIFLDNSVPWRTINNPYIRKFFDLVITDWESEVEELDDFEAIEFSFEEYDEEKYVNYIPVWNINKVEQKGEGFPLAADDKINYDHIVSLKKLGTEHGYLVDNSQFNILSVKRRGDELVITSDESNSVSWELLQVVQEDRDWEEEFDFELLSNLREDNFLNKFVPRGGKNIRTKGELKRIVNSFSKINRFTLEDVEITDSVPESAVTYDFNSFIEDEIRVDNRRQVLKMTFVSDEDDYLQEDLLSFLVSEIQLHFPEYICKGVLKE